MQHAHILETTPLSASPSIDEQILHRIASGDRDALAELYARYQRSLFRYLCHLTPDRGLAEEILQDTLVAVWRSAGSFAGRSSVHSWLIGVARRQAHNSLRRRGLPTADAAELDTLLDPATTPEDRALAHAEREDIARAIGSLAPLHREVLALNFIQGLSYSEIAHVLDVPEGTVKSRLSNAKRTLRALIDPRQLDPRKEA